MSESAKGDEELIGLLSKLAAEIKNYAELFLSISKDLDDSIIRLNAVIYPTPENRLKAISLPSMDSIGSSVRENVNDAKNKTKEIVSLLKKAEDIMNNLKIECSFCDGKGEVSVLSYHRDKETIQPYFETKKCPKCYGDGYLEVSETVAQITIQLVNCLRELTGKEIKNNSS
ncbi:MAG: hypothetical protein QXH91_06270 [Candidatus Bathyarchaeia archaeon]|nr:hypothetical protein [Candidatus Bathyarchaeota archaeon]